MNQSLRIMMAWSLVIASGMSRAAETMSFDDWSLRVFSHFEAAAGDKELFSNDLSLGESALFLTGRLSSRWSFLSEVSFQPKKYRDDTVKVERARFKYQISSNHWFSFGKMHTPVNEWNDSYHHGRLFFPTIERPQSFSEFVPIHEVGLRFSGEGLGARNAFYDVVVGSGQSAHDDIFPNGARSLTVSGGLWIKDNLKWRVSVYRDKLIDYMASESHGVLVDMSSAAQSNDLEYTAYGSSLYYSGSKVDAKAEAYIFKTEGAKSSYSLFQRLGLPLTANLTPYVFFDFLRVDASEHHFAEGYSRKAGLGLEWLTGATSSLKLELINQDIDRKNKREDGAVVKLQFAIGI